jgi:hypothetical protein
VQQVLKQKNQSVCYVDKPFYTYRGLIRCTCGRSYVPYEQKGSVYYRSFCRAECNNKDRNLSVWGFYLAIVERVLENVLNRFVVHRPGDLWQSGWVEVAEHFLLGSFSGFAHSDCRVRGTNLCQPSLHWPWMIADVAKKSVFAQAVQAFRLGA